MKEFDPTDIEGQQHAQQELQQKLKLETDTEESDFKWLMKQKRGRRIVWRFLDSAGVFRTSFNTNSMTMAFNEGNRNVGLKLVALIHSLCPELYIEMVKEQTDGRDNSAD